MTCNAAGLVEDLDDGRAVVLRMILDDADYPPGLVGEACEEMEVPLEAAEVQDHRNGDCKCDKGQK